jgi:site-specific DNA recombinase
LHHPGQHEAIIDQALWDQLQQHMAGNRIGNKMHSRKTDPSPLAGRLFDVSGERLVPIYANKKGRRYRYYISQSLTTSPKETAMSGWRLPGQEMDKTIIQSVLAILNDQDAITTACCDTGIASQHLPAAFKTASGADAVTIIEKFIDRVELRPDGISLTLSLASLVPAKDISIKITRDIPLQMKRRGVEMRLIIGGSNPAKMDPTLIKAIIRARGWFDELMAGRLTTLTAIASRDGIDLGTVSRMLNLAFLAPSIIDSIIAGHQPADLTVEKLIKKVDLPLDWVEQKRLLGIA